VSSTSKSTIVFLIGRSLSGMIGAGASGVAIFTVFDEICNCLVPFGQRELLESLGLLDAVVRFAHRLIDLLGEANIWHAEKYQKLHRERRGCIY
jgi:hypothetical protein